MTLPSAGLFTPFPAANALPWHQVPSTGAVILVVMILMDQGAWSPSCSPNVWEAQHRVEKWKVTCPSLRASITQGSRSHTWAPKVVEPSSCQRIRRQQGWKLTAHPAPLGTPGHPRQLGWRLARGSAEGAPGTTPSWPGGKGTGFDLAPYKRAGHVRATA